MDINSILSQLGVTTKETVYMSITPGVGLEVIQLDIQAKTVKNYGFRPLEYNESLRELSDINGFKDAVVDLFDELKINIKSNIVLNVPMVLMGSKELPILLGDDAVTEALTSEAEQSYIFKRYEPTISWVDASTSQNGETRRLFYSAIQKNVLDDIKNALAELGAKLVGVEVSLMSLIKALIFSGYLEDQTKDGVSWNLMIINQTGYSICSMLGKRIVDYYEEPLAIKSFEGDEIYNAINASAQIALMSFPANYLYVVSETDLVSAEILTSRLQADGQINYIENNQYKKQDVIPVSLEVLEETAHKISLEAIGVAVANEVNLPVRFNFLGGATGDGAKDDPDELVHVVLGSYEFDISPNIAKVYSIIAAVLLVIPMLLLAIIFPIIGGQKQKQLDEINSKLSGVQAEISNLEDEQNKSKDFDVNSEVKRVIGENRSKLMAYIAIGDSVPKKLWLTYFVAKDDGKFNIKGQAKNVEDVYTFYKNMKDSLINTQLRLHKLELTGNSEGEEDIVPLSSSNYDFEITNMSEADMNSPAEAPQNNEESNNEENNNKKGKLINKPLINNDESE